MNDRPSLSTRLSLRHRFSTIVDLAFALSCSSALVFGTTLLLAGSAGLWVR